MEKFNVGLKWMKKRLCLQKTSCMIAGLPQAVLSKISLILCDKNSLFELFLKKIPLNKASFID